MKKILSFAALFFAIAMISFAQQKVAPPKKIDYKKKGAPVPPFRIEKTAGGTLTNANLKPGKPVMVLIFSPQCDHCEHTMDSLKKVADQFKNTQLLLVAEDRNKEFMKDFIKKTDIGTHPLFQKIGTNKGELIFSIYTYKILPQVNIYNDKHRLVQTLDGNFPFDSLRMFIQ
ncbi:MAG: redoxin domain-containing protein [Chitinophagaceae bacterium]|nr:MAG: redoxin domain-containing protein [Chitinophagaceae bacterium]